MNRLIFNILIVAVFSSCSNKEIRNESVTNIASINTSSDNDFLTNADIIGIWKLDSLFFEPDNQFYYVQPEYYLFRQDSILLISDSISDLISSEPFQSSKVYYWELDSNSLTKYFSIEEKHDSDNATKHFIKGSMQTLYTDVKLADSILMFYDRKFKNVYYLSKR